MAKAKPPRRRREPEQARQEILEAAERVIASRGPDAVGLKDVAREAGVSHGLITHYFGTYAALVRAVLERRLEIARAEAFRLVSSPDFDPGRTPLLDVLFSLLRDPVHVRLTTWSLLSAEPRAEGRPPVLPLTEVGLAPLVDGILARREELAGRPLPPSARTEVEFTLIAALSAGYGFALAKRLFFAALGTTLSEEEFERRLGEMLRAYMDAADGRLARGGPP